MKKISLLMMLGLAGIAARGQVQINGPLYLSQGAVMAVAGGNVAAATDVLGNGTLLLNGTAGQSIDLGGKRITRLEVSNSAGVTLGGGAQVDTALILTNGSVALGNNNLVLSAGGSVLGAAAGKYLITNGTGVVTKEGLAQNASFTFPIGQAAGDYTPASVNNQEAATRNFSAQVKTYANSAPFEGNATKGIDRTFQITSNVKGLTNIGLTHNDADNANGLRSSGTAFNPAAAYVTQYRGNNVWNATTATFNGGSPVNTVGASYFVPVSGDSSYFSKTSDQVTSLSGRLMVNPTALLQGAWNSGLGAMTTLLNSQNLIPLSQPYSVAPFNYAGTESVTAIPANVTDWVLVDLRSEITSTNTSSSIIATRAAFIKNNGQIVDVDGVSPVSFTGVPAANYIIALRHRNHLGVQSNTAKAISLENTTAQDFTAAANVYRSAVTADNNEPQAMLAAGKYGLWAGNTNSNGTIRVNGAASVNDNLWIINNVLGTNPSNVVTSVYSNGDVNMNGTVRVTGAVSINDNLFIVNNALGTDPSTTLVQHQQ